MPKSDLSALQPITFANVRPETMTQLVRMPKVDFDFQTCMAFRATGPNAEASVCP